MPTDDDDDEIIIIRRAKSITTLRVISNDNAGALEQSEAGELREVADLLEDTGRASWLRQAWTLMLLRRYFFPQ